MTSPSSPLPAAPSSGASKAQWRQFLRTSMREDGPALVSEVALATFSGQLQPAANVVSFCPLPHELNVSIFNALARERAARVWVPLGNKVPAGVAVTDLPVGFRPHGELHGWRRGEGLGQLQPELVLIPALAVDGRGVRLGQGGGWYDRALSELAEDVPVVGCVPQSRFLRTTALPVEPHDIRVQAVATETGYWELPLE